MYPAPYSPYKSTASLHSHTQNDFVACFNYNYAPSQWNREIVKVQKLEKSRCYAMLVLHSTKNVQLTKSPKAHNQPVMSLLKGLENIVFFNVLDDFWELRYRGPIWPLKRDVSALFVHHLAIFFFNWCCLYYVYRPYTAFMLPSLLNEITIIEIHLCETFIWLNTGKKDGKDRIWCHWSRQQHTILTSQLNYTNYSVLHSTKFFTPRTT